MKKNYVITITPKQSNQKKTISFRATRSTAVENFDLACWASTKGTKVELAQAETGVTLFVAERTV